MKNFINIRESSSEYGKSLRKIANDKKLKSISTKDKQTLSKIADMLAKANEGAEKYTVQKGKMQRKVDGKTADKMKKQGWKLIATEEVQEEGLQEEKIAILTSVYKSVKREMDTLMKKHDAYVSDTSRAGTTISSPKPMKAFIKDVQKLIGLTESIDIIAEGTWSVPDSKDKLKTLDKYLVKPAKFTKPKQIEQWTNGIYSLFGDDEFFDSLGVLQTLSDPKEKGSDLYKRSEELAKKKNLKVGMDLRDILVKHLTDWTKGGVKFKGYKITHAPMAWVNNLDEAQSPAQKAAFAKMIAGNDKKNGKDKKDDVEETAKKRKTGNIKYAKSKSIALESVTENVKNYAVKKDPLDRAERVLNYKLKELQYKTALKTFNEYAGDPEVNKEAKGATGLNNAALVKRVPSRFKGIDQKTAQRVADAVKPKGMISSKLYMELGDLWDKKNTKGFEALLKKHKV